ncbi:hypothetical protein RUND412_002408 [Rhizina undulata]
MKVGIALSLAGGMGMVAEGMAAAVVVGKDHLPVPLVIWHGLGDTYDSDGIRSVVELAQEMYPGTYVHPIYIDADLSADRSASFFGLVDDQLSTVCAQLSSIPELATGFNAVGFSQGGQFLRGYVERCNSPPVKTLITFGAQHNGISDFFGACKKSDLICRSAGSLLRSSKWASWVQNRVVPAQYFRDPEDLEPYLKHSAFLADINGERPEDRNETYRENLASLEKFVMYMFADDTTVVPKQSSWFAEYNKSTDVVIPLEERDIYKEDWIGLRRLGEQGKLVFSVTKGEHMRLNDAVLSDAFERFFGPGKKKSPKEPKLLNLQVPGF